MARAIDTLMMEHRLIEQVLGSLESFLDRVASGESEGRARVADYAAFLQNFADKCHHGKEEDRLFTKMNQFGFPSEFGPIGMMLAEHTEGRRHVVVLASVGAGSGPMSDEEMNDVIRHGSGFIELLRSHIQKEDNILYPMAIQALPPAEMEALADDFEAFEAGVMGESAHERFHALAESLIEAYPPNPLRMSQASSCFTCAGHM